MNSLHIAQRGNWHEILYLIILGLTINCTKYYCKPTWPGREVLIPHPTNKSMLSSSGLWFSEFQAHASPPLLQFQSCKSHMLVLMQTLACLLITHRTTLDGTHSIILPAFLARSRKENLRGKHRGIRHCIDC